MKTVHTHPEHLFDRGWRPGHPFRARLTRLRRWGMTVLFLVLCAIIGGYWYITDANRVREMAESYLSDLVGGPVAVGDARLSIFEGLRLDGVRVSADDSGSPDSLLFTADTLLLKYNPRTMLKGRLDATRIIAINPRVHLSENLDDGSWNYQRLLKVDPPSMPGSEEGAPGLTPPEVLLRNAQFIYSDLHDGVLVQRGTMDIEGRLWPGTDTGRYHFELQSRGALEGVGAVASGSVLFPSGQVNMRLGRLRFGPDFRSLLMAEVRQFWEQHQLQGRLDIPEFTFTPGRDGKEATFRVEMELDGVTLVIHPEEFNSREENQRLDRVRDALALMNRTHLNAGGMIQPFNQMFHPPPIQLERVAGTFVFTEKGVWIKRISGRIETNAFVASGRIDGYSPDAAGSLRIWTPPSENIYIPHVPRYVDSLPPAVREVYDRFRPEGTARAMIELVRPAPGARPEVTGEIEIVDGQFMFDHFPYPVRNATGRIVLGVDPVSGQERLDIKDLRGQGAVGTPNADSFIHVNGYISPFGPTAGVRMVVSGDEISSDPILRASFPSETRQALQMLDPDGKGDFPRFNGSFTCEVIRPVGYRTNWIINTDITLDDASGALVAFPYPLEHVTALLRVRQGQVEIVNAAMKQGDAALLINGIVRFGEDQPVTPDLEISARNVPIDQKLLDALPRERREWLASVGLTGKVDIEGRIQGASMRPAGDPVAQGREPATPTLYPATAHPVAAPSDTAPSDTAQAVTVQAVDEVNVDLALTLREGTAWPVAGQPMLTDLEGTMRLSDGNLLITKLSGRRGPSPISARGRIDWQGGSPRAVLNVTAEDLLLDEGVYNLLPAGARSGWEQVNPEGSVDLRINYSGELTAGTTRPVVDTVTRPVVNTVAVEAGERPAGAAPSGFELAITPRTLSVKPEVFPYALENLTGTVTVTADRVVLKDVTAGHGPARIALSGTGTLGEREVWDLSLRASDVPVDDQLRAALPESLATVFTGLKLDGTIDVDFSRLRVESNSKETASATTSVPVATRPSTLQKVDWAATIHANGATLNVGVPLGEVSGRMELSGAVRNGRMSDLTGHIDLPSLRIAGREASNLSVDLHKSADHPVLTVDNLRAQLSGGDLAGQVKLEIPEEGDSSYSISLLLRNASVRELAGQFEPDLQGHLTASLALEGKWDDPDSRRGRGDVLATGRNMYRIPVLLGLLEIANLSLPINSPFNEASARYMVQGPKVTFEQIRLKSANMLMEGSGVLDFATKRVRMTFTTANPNWPKLPFIADLIQGARSQLLQIHVRGTIEEPKVSASSLNTFTTTVDEVFRDERK